MHLASTPALGMPGTQEDAPILQPQVGDITPSPESVKKDAGCREGSSLVETIRQPFVPGDRGVIGKAFWNKSYPSGEYTECFGIYW